MLTTIRGGRETIGAVGLELRGRDRLTLGYVLAPDLWGNGYASEAVAAMVEAAFSLTHVLEINASVRVENPASRRVLEKAGFRFVSTGVQGAPARGGLVECDRFALGRSEWAARPKTKIANENVHEVS
jgi:RimJ/RimL family protein N-acetyltransferase